MKKYFKIFRLESADFIVKGDSSSDYEDYYKDGIYLYNYHDDKFETEDLAIAELEKRYKNGDTFGYNYTIIPVYETK